MIDPPEGWKYGFPKPLPNGVDLSEWLFGEGYPSDLIPLAMKYSRYWEEDIERYDV
jgi:hypothetical protein